jgi:DNA-binding MurR/RpiR family transcriptional regulator
MDKTGSNGSDFAQLISGVYGTLTKSEKRIANFFRKNQDESSFLSAAEIAERLDLSEATIVRFARTLGYPSFPALRNQLQEHFRHRITHSSRLRSRLDDLRETGDIYERLTATEIDYLSQALESVDRNAITESVKMIQSHQRIFVFGLGPSISLVDLMEIRLRRFGKDVVTLKSSGREALEKLILLKRDDLVFVICFFDQNPTLNLVLDFARKTGSTIVMLTDTLDSVIGSQADVILAAQRGPVGEFHSLVVPMTIINAILLTIASEAQEKIMPVLDKLDCLREQLKDLNTQDK